MSPTWWANCLDPVIAIYHPLRLIYKHAVDSHEICNHPRRKIIKLYTPIFGDEMIESYQMAAKNSVCLCRN
ncbi:hypothetical protein CANTEDRAFT_112297 [Yamadazyma tenuis ATCC 10573]|uniref:Uncharacterized protein n=1 Tax=Candida tenuis (strain ATCC 10573 / BCRC 21748 / CBS 615 / JCM 9827 / NBRC 10315 / NRRL Y-1498 / VKM Y-70) TaxID=590646 RepID=G3AWN9_CANTC|nr:uncharacterized protein CANTEDRAFT_112297 [Yamadazyma tenuis ATCC 10573]EGV66581.1 hypothetical protein CANTEDRAFT_112297 [Yamadazyma tenuis ATCC 10573]